MGKDTDSDSEEDVFKPRKPSIKPKWNASQNTKNKTLSKKKSEPGSSSHSRKEIKSQAKTNKSKKKMENDNHSKSAKNVQNPEVIAGASSEADGIVSVQTSVKEESHTDCFCPICQVPLKLLKISATMHTASCDVSGSLPACPDGRNCLNMNIFHYRDFSHEELAAFRDSENYVEPDITFTPQKARAKQTPKKASGTKRPSKSPAMSQRKMLKRGEENSIKKTLPSSPGDSVDNTDSIDVPDALRKHLFKEDECSDRFLPEKEGVPEENFLERMTTELHQRPVDFVQVSSSAFDLNPDEPATLRDLEENINTENESASLEVEENIMVKDEPASLEIERNITVKNEPLSQGDIVEDFNIEKEPASLKYDEKDVKANFSNAQVTIHYDLSMDGGELNLKRNRMECSENCIRTLAEDNDSLQTTCNVIIKTSGIRRREAMLRSPMAVTLMINESGWEALEIKGRQSANLRNLDVTLCQCGSSVCVCMRVNDPAIHDVKFNPQDCEQHDKFFATMMDLGLKSKETYVQPLNDDIMLKKMFIMQNCHQLTVSSAVKQEERNTSTSASDQPNEIAEIVNDERNTLEPNLLVEVADTWSMNPDDNQSNSLPGNPDYNQNVNGENHSVETKQALNTLPKPTAFSFLKQSSSTSAPRVSKSRRPSTPSSVKSSNGSSRPSTPVSLVVSKTTDTSWTLVPGERKQTSATVRASTRKVPAYKRIPDTQFVVDAFNFGVIPGVKAYFLSHFHSDHYIGLRKDFSMPIFCSQVTANLVHLKIKVDNKYLKILKIDEPLAIYGVEVEIFDANHCPGAVMFLFRLLDGRTFLHVGDFRAHPAMEDFPQIRQVDKLYLDTTYCDPAYDFPFQDDVVSKVVDTVKYHLNQNKSTLIVCGTYTIGKEKVFMGIAEAFNFKIWTHGEKKKVLHCLENKQLLDRLTTDPSLAQVHVVAMRDIALEELNKYLSKYSPKFTHIVGFKPTGWTTSNSLKGKPTDFQKSTRGKVTIYGVPYSEHSSFSELRRFVRHIRPKDIQVTVNVGKAAQYKKMFQEWLSNSRDGSGQSKMLQYFTSSSREPSR